MPSTVLPSDLLRWWHHGLHPDGTVALDTETSGLYADDGARVATVSVAFVVDDNWPGPYQVVDIAPDAPAVNIAAFAWPFDQGTEGKPEDNGQVSLFEQEPNLPFSEWDDLCSWLDLVGQRGGLVMHPAKFDCEKMRVGTRRWPRPTDKGWSPGIDLIDHVRWDTQNVNNLIWPLQPHPDTGKPTSSLKPTAMRLFGVEQGDEQKVVKSYLQKAKLPSGRWDLMPWDVIGKYAADDARMTKMIELRQQWEIDNGKAGQWLTDVYATAARRLRVSKLLYRMEWRGLPYDEVGSREAADACRERAAKIAEKLPFRPTDPAAKDYFFGSSDKRTDKGVACCDLVPYSVTDTGQPSLTAEILGRMVADEVPYAAKWAEYKKVATAASMWYEGYADAMGSDGRLRTCFRQNGARSTRFSVERVNLQAIPQDYRLSEFSVLDGIPTPRALIGRAVKSMPGWSLYELDLAQAELRVAAMMANCESMLSMIVDGTDLHTYTTYELFKIGPDDERFGEYRQVGKRGNFSLIFGSGWETFQKMVAKEVGIYLEDHVAQRIVRDWNGLYPEFRVAIERHQARVEKRQQKYGEGWIDLVTGERRWFEKYEEAHKAFNQRVQSNLAQFGMDWMLQTDDFLRSKGLDVDGVTPDGGRAGLLLTIHDSQVLLLPDEHAEEWAATCAGFGKNLWREFFAGVPGDVDYKRWDK